MADANTAGTVDVRCHRGIAVITLRREHKGNALSTHMETELLRAVRSSEVESSKAVVVTGGDTVFSAGLPQPTVAAITGYCLGGGLELALAADIRIADPAADFGFPEIGIGILPSSGGLTRIVRAVGEGRARDLVLRGRRFDARQAEQWGIVSEIACAGEHVKRATEIAHELAGYSPVALRVKKGCSTPASTRRGKPPCCSSSWPTRSSTRPAKATVCCRALPDRCPNGR